MVWQDFLLSIANLILSVSLFPQIFKGFKKKKGFISFYTSIPTFLSLYSISFAYFTLDLLFSSISSFVAASLWFVLFIQRIIYERI